MIVGMGIDLISVARIRRAHERLGKRFLERVFTAGEIAYCLEARDPSERLAARWAAKEACMKALGTGWAKGVQFNHIALLTGDDRGAPKLELTAEALSLSKRLNVARSHCSVSHSDGFAVATVVLES
jgi:holo-[acyl-carrier protein] synthase